MLYGTIVIGMLILLVACFNFMSLATAQATLRAAARGGSTALHEDVVA